MSQVVIADLTTPRGVKLLWQWLEDERAVWVLALPCGSASRARQILMGNKRRFHGPRPLRNDKHPNGRPSLSFLPLANKLYDLPLG